MDIYEITQARSEEKLNQRAATMSYDEMLHNLKNNHAYHSPEFQAALRKAINELNQRK